ncbi:Uncharacterised protein [Segatella copri]|nr:Uncharacterised protein [Segatella copri]
MPRIHLLFALSLLLSSWGTSIVQRPLLLVMVEAEVLAVVGVKRMTRMTSLSVADALEWLCT